MGAPNSYSVTERPVNSWDEYFYELARTTARNSKCLSRRIGAVLVRDKSIIDIGYNGPPRGVGMCDTPRWKTDKTLIEKYNDKMDVAGKCPRRVLGLKSGEGLDLCVAGHAERNSLINAARNGKKVKGSTMYVTCGIPCTPCLVEIINAGVEEVVVTSVDMYDRSSEYLLTQSNLKIRLYDFIK
jgi:dCMP deaminase